MMKRVFCIVLAAAVFLCGCAYGADEQSENGLAVYRVENSESGMRLVRETISPGDGTRPHQLVAEALCSGETEGAVHSAFPEGVVIEGVVVENGVAKVDMSEAYRELRGSGLLLAESALVLSFCAIDEICSVRIYCGGRLLADGLNEENISWADGLCGAYERSAKLFLPEEGGSTLKPRTVKVTDDGSMSPPERIMSGIFTELKGMESARVLKCETDGGVCSIDLSHEFYGAEPPDSYTGMLMIYSIVNSLCRVPGVEAVSLSVEGYPVNSYGGFRINWPLYPNENHIEY